MTSPFGRTIAKLARQKGSPSMETRTHRANRTAQRRRRVHITQFVKIAKDDGLPIPHRQRDDRPPERFEMTAAIEIADWIDFNRELRGSGLRFVVERQGRPDRARGARNCGRCRAARA